MHTVETLLDAAIEKYGTSAELARQLGVHRSEVSEWKSGRRPVSPCSAGLMAAALNLDPEEARHLCAEATVACSRPEIQERLRRALFTVLSVGVALSAATPSDATTRGTQALRDATVDGLYIVAHSLLAFGLRPIARLRPLFSAISRGIAASDGARA